MSLGSFVHTPGYQFDPSCPSVTRGPQGSKLAAVGCVLVLGARDKASVLTGAPVQAEEGSR